MMLYFMRRMQNLDNLNIIVTVSDLALVMAWGQTANIYLNCRMCVGKAKWILHCRGRKSQSFEPACK